MARCSECGFLAVRNEETRNLEEIELESRQDGNIKTARYYYIPSCFAMIAHFGDELKELRKSPDYAEKRNALGEVVGHQWKDLVKVVFNKERECKSFIKWHQGFSPREHQEMIDRKWEKKWHWIEIGIIIVVTAIVNYLIWILTGH